MPADPLANLRPYHLPSPVSWWPPAPGWWVLLGVLLALSLVSVRWWRRRKQRRAAADRALAELAELQAEYLREESAPGFAREVSKLLRRFALVAYRKDSVGGLTGESWLEFLDANGGGGRFVQGPGRLLLDAPYRPDNVPGMADLTALATQWIRQNREVSA
ncbi:MAG: DUF4381 domain-containing protein [Chromatiales bacterium]|nr:DUF4381 domain-containing protein [Chromatiales bacterium]